jgi:myo-inositol-hexaphosphate 3-phosphohydrolase
MRDYSHMKWHKSEVAALWTLVGCLNVFAQPVITVQPRPQQVPFGGSTTLWVEATGTERLTYQWFFNTPTNLVPGATNTFLSISQARDSDAGNYLVRVANPQGFAWSTPAGLTLFSRGLPAFGTNTLAPAFQLDGVGSDVDSIAFWEAPDPTNTLLFVTAKANDLLEVWKYPFQGNELPSVRFSTNVNGVVVDQETDRLYVSDRKVSVFSLPDLQLLDEFGQGIIGVGENNLDILKHVNGQTFIYVSDNHSVHRFVADTWNHLGSFAPPVTSIETVLADDFYQMILVPEEQGPLGSPGVYAYRPDGTPFMRNGTNRLGNNGQFDSDEEGILLYTFPTDGKGDNGAGFYVVSDQRIDQTDFEFFDRETWSHLGTLRLAGVSNTDGIASTQLPMPGYPMGLFAAINNDTNTVGVGWDVIFQAIGVNPVPRVLAITPTDSGPTNANAVDFTVRFNKPVTNFNEASDVVITHRGTASAGAVITGGGDTFNVRVTGISGRGFFMLAVSTASDIVDFETNTLVSSVTSVPVFIDSPYRSWAAARGLDPGVNDGFSNDPDGDGTLNIKEFAIDGDPLSGVNDGKQRVVIEDVGETNYFTYTFAIRNGAVFVGNGELSAALDGVFYSVAGSFDLISFDNDIVEQVPATETGLPALNPGWSYRTFRLNRAIANQPQGFIRLRIGEAP